MDFTSSFSQTVAFKNSTGVLELAQSQGFAGTIYGFSTTGATSLDLRDIAFGGATQVSFSGTTSSGMLTVTDGSHTAHIHLAGNYTSAGFVANSDGQGGTVVTATQNGMSKAPCRSWQNVGDQTHLFTAAVAGFGARAATLGGRLAEMPHVSSPMLASPKGSILAQ